MSGNDYRSEVERALKNSEVVSKSDYLRWTRNGNLPTQARAYQLSARAGPRIKPELTLDEQCQFMMDHLLACLEVDPAPDEYLQNGFEAGRSLADWLKHLHRISGTAHVIANVANGLALLYKRLDASGRNRVETGALEHILERPDLRDYFDFWQDDPVLREAYVPALEWGLAHTDA